MKRYRFGWLLVTVLLVAILAGCGGRSPSGGTDPSAGQGGSQQAAGQENGQQSTGQGNEQQGAGSHTEAPEAGGGAAQAAYPITLVDGAGREVTIEAEPQRILSLGPSATEVIFALGRGDRLVGRTDWCNFPEAALEVPAVGSLFPPDYERILATEPDLVIMIEGSVEVRDRLEQEYGLKTFVFAPATFEDLFTEMVALGRALGAPEAAEALVAEMRAEVEEIESTTLRISYRPVVFYEVWPDPLSTAGPGSFIDDMIRIAGGINAAGNADGPWPSFSVEQLLAADPEIIVTGSPDMVQDVLTRPGWESVRAVQEGRVVAVPNEDIVVRPGPRLIEGLRWFAATLHPGLFAQ